MSAKGYRTVKGGAGYGQSTVIDGGWEWVCVSRRAEQSFLASFRWGLSFKLRTLYAFQDPAGPAHLPS